ncbi:hypothetical protein HK099_008179, partial [Clydaea vesicula]
FTNDHEWVLVKDEIATIGITDYAQNSLGDVVYLETPTVGKSYSQSEIMGAVESVKAASDIYAPISGEVTEVNTKLNEEPSLVNTSPYENGWIAKLKINKPEELEKLLNKEDYKKLIEE